MESFLQLNPLKSPVQNPYINIIYLKIWKYITILDTFFAFPTPVMLSSLGWLPQV